MQINEGSFRKIFYLNMGSYECKTYLKLFHANFETITICDGKKHKCFFEIASCWKQEGQVPSLSLLVRLYTNLKSLSSKCWEHTLVLDTLKYLFWSFFLSKFLICFKRNWNTTTTFKNWDKTELFFWPFTHAD